METPLIGLISVIILLVLSLSGVYIGVALALTSVLGLWWITGKLGIAVSLLGMASLSAINSYAFAVIPLFVLMGLLSNLSGASNELYSAAHLSMRRIRGGLGIATVISNAIFAALTGSSVASAAVFSKISLPEMERYGYNKKFALGVVAGSSVLGMLIPPSILMVVYGILTEQSIGKLFIAGVIPGMLLAMIYSVGIYGVAKFYPGMVPANDYQQQEMSRKEMFGTLLKPWGMILLIVVILGGIYNGFFTPIEAGAVGAFGALIITFAKRRLKFKGFWQALVETGFTTASILFLLIAASMYTSMLARSGFTNWISEFFLSLSVAPIIIIIAMLVVMIILGTILDSTSILLLMVPIVAPIVTSFGYDLIWFGIVAILTIETGLITPPFGLSVYTIKSSLGDKVKLEDIFKGSFMFFIMMLLCLAILVAFPRLTTWLPGLM